MRREAATGQIEIVSVTQVIGLWEGRLEPAASVEVVGEPTTVLGLAERLRQAYNQDAVIVFRSTPEGRQAMYSIEGVRDVDYANALLRRFEIEGGRFVGGRLEIADLDGSLYQKAVALSRLLGSALEVTAGELVFIARPEDRKE